MRKAEKVDEHFPRWFWTRLNEECEETKEKWNVRRRKRGWMASVIFEQLYAELIFQTTQINKTKQNKKEQKLQLYYLDQVF